MAYVTSSEVIARLGGTAAATTLTTETGDTPDTDLIDQWIAEAEARVQQAIRARTTATITQADYPQTWALARGCVFDMVCYRARSRRPPVPKDVADVNTRAIEWLDRLVEGKIDLPDTALNEPDLEYGGEEQNAAADRG